MKKPQLHIRSLLLVVAVSSLISLGIATALRRPGRPYSALFLYFNPVMLFSKQPGVLSVQGVTGGGTFNKRLGGSFREWRGVIRSVGSRVEPQVFQKAITNYVETECQGAASWVNQTVANDAQGKPLDVHTPLYMSVIFNQGDRHGEMHFWLMPDSSDTTMGYVVALQEEPID